MNMQHRFEAKGAEDDAGAGDAAAEVRTAVEALQGAFEEFRAGHEQKLREVETKAAPDPKLKERLDRLEAKMNRPGTGETKDGPTDEQKSFGVYLRRGDAAIGELEKKTLRVAVDAQGGYLAPPEFSSEFIRNVVEFSPIRSIASVRTTSAPSVKYPARVGVTNAQWVGEIEERPASEPTFGQHEIPVREVATYVDVSNQLLQDSGGTAETEIRQAFAEDFGAKEGAAFVAGDGVLAPKGFMTDPAVAYVPNGHATNLSADALISLMYSVPAAYRNRGTWVMSGATIATVRKLKDGQGNYLWQPAFVAGQPETILGRPVVDAVDMDDVASGTFPIAFGDFNAGYRVVDRLELSVLVNPYLLATKGITRIHGTRRVGGGVIRPDAIRKLKMATS